MSKKKIKNNLVKNDRYYSVHLNKKGHPVHLEFICNQTKRALFVFTKQTTSMHKGYALSIAECADSYTTSIRRLSISDLKKFISKFENKSVDEAFEFFSNYKIKTRRFQN